MSFLKKFIKNKVLVLSVSVIVVSLVYTGVQKAIDNYNFNNDIVTSDEFGNADDSGAAEADGEEKSEISAGAEDATQSESGELSSEETELVLEEVEGESTGAKEEGADSENKADDEVDAQSKIYVYVTGEVNNPGVVILNEGSRIVDAINAAGGTTAKANVSKVNLVYVLDDGMKVNIPNNNDLKNNSDFEYITMNSGDGGNDDYSGGSSSSGASTEAGTGSSSSGAQKYDVVNINTATQTELETLPGIGPSLALKIINYRKENGKFSSIEQIKDVSGIGESKFESLKGYITI